MDDYPLIADHGLIGDLQTAALVSTDGSIDWFCCPRFDSPSVFGSLLDSRHGGRCRIAPRHGDCTVKQLYFPDTAILITRFMTEDGVGEVTDFMPVTGSAVTLKLMTYAPSGALVAAPTAGEPVTLCHSSAGAPWNGPRM